MNMMWSDFAAGFVGALVGACVIYPVWRRRRPPEARNIWADVIEILALALGFSSSPLAYGLYPELRHGVARYVTAICLALGIILIGRGWAARLRRRLL
jgi:uncharacterized membrane protein YccC